jgi:hypothetical protein
MTNDQRSFASGAAFARRCCRNYRRSNAAPLASPVLVIRHWSLIHHSSFVIRH